MQGRDSKLALDCVGVAAHALASVGVTPIIPRDYTLKSDNRLRLFAGLRRTGLTQVAPPAAVAGDLLQIEVAPGHHHLAINTGVSIVHADFSVGRVVEVTLPTHWTLVAAWRLPEDITWRR